MSEHLDRPLAGIGFHHLAYLRAAAEGPTWTAAADALGITQSALSQGLAYLERRLGVLLFERSGRRRALTDDGADLAKFAAVALAEADRLERRMGDRRAGRAGSLRVGMIDAAGLYLFPAAVRRFRTEHPGVELQLMIDSSDALLLQVQRGGLDLALVVAPAAGVESEELLSEPLFVYAPAGHGGEPAEDHDWALYPEGSHTRAVIDSGLTGLGIHPRVVLESPNPSVLRQMADLGLGWTVLPRAVAETGSRPLRRWGDAVAERRLLEVHRRGALDARARRFLDTVRADVPSP